MVGEYLGDIHFVKKMFCAQTKMRACISQAVAEREPNTRGGQNEWTAQKRLGVIKTPED